jgi:rare lipoprotein A
MDAGKMTAAPRVTVVNHSNGRSVVVRINDRRPLVRGGVIDLSPAAGRTLNIDGLASVSLIVYDIDYEHANERSAEGIALQQPNIPKSVRPRTWQQRATCAAGGRLRRGRNARRRSANQ